MTLIIIPLGGLGTRFKTCGYTKPKPLVSAMGKPILYWLLSSLHLNPGDIVIIPYNQELEPYLFETGVRDKFPHISFIFHKLKYDTRGAAETLEITLNMIRSRGDISDCPILSLDGDNFYTCDIISLWGGRNGVFCFKDETEAPIYSYIRSGDNNIITEIKEKVKISDLACTGAYGFASWHTLLRYCQNIIEKNIRDKEEFYISTVIREMIRDKVGQFVAFQIPVENYICLGTPLHVRLFCNNYPLIHAVKTERMVDSSTYCFEIVNTLIIYDGGNYIPSVKHIDLTRYLHRLGHKIIIHTSLGEFWNGIKVVDLLDKFAVYYDEIFYNRPRADYYIDSRNVSLHGNLENELGFYNSMINPRDFHKIATSSINLLRKSSVGTGNLAGEIYYYQNIPPEIKDLFPVFVNYDENCDTWFEMEKINGIPVSKLYLSRGLTKLHLEHVMGSIRRIHAAKPPVNLQEVDIYVNYAQKLRERCCANPHIYNDETLRGCTSVYTALCKRLDEYEQGKGGICGVIHGDPVLTNILINQFGKIKFIDMRGKLGKTLSIEGDIFYDWGKLYQSLVGYDEIMDDVQLPDSYRNEISAHFQKVFLQSYSETQFEWVKIITASLFFSLLPLHTDERKIVKYYMCARNLLGM